MLLTSMHNRRLLILNLSQDEDRYPRLWKHAFRGIYATSMSGVPFTRRDFPSSFLLRNVGLQYRTRRSDRGMWIEVQLL